MSAFYVTYQAPANTLLGQLQRGRGAGFLRALDQRPRYVRPLLIQCIRDDPRWDHQIDHRGDYYAQLISAINMELSPLERHIHEHDDQGESTSRSSLAIEILGALAKRGSDQAMGILRGYIGSGYHVQRALEELADARDADAWRGLDEVLSARFQDPEVLSCQIHWTPLDKPPWKEWVRAPTPVGKMLRARRRKLKTQPEPHPDYASMTTEELLDWADRNRSWRCVTDVLASRDSAEDTAILLQAIDESRPWRAIAALRALAPRGDVRVFEPAKAVIERFRWGGWQRRRQSPQLRIAAAKALVQLPPDVVLPLARRWRSSPAWKFRRTAIDILERHATAEDIPWIQKQLGRRITDHRVYFLCNYAQLLAKFPEHGPFPALRRIFREFPYSYGRRFLAEAMAATDPLFGGDLAVECLWDCEASVRLPGARSVDARLANATGRLEFLANDGLEDPDVREAAQARLAVQ